MAKKYALGIDIGGTKVAVAVVDRSGEIAFRHELPSVTTSAEALFEVVLTCIDEVLTAAGLAMANVHGVGAGVPGKVDEINGVAIYQNNIPWQYYPFVEKLRAVYGSDLKVAMDNDVKVAAYAEYVTHRVPASATFTYVTISTGLAATSIVNDTVLRGAGFSGEIGFLPVVGEGEDVSLEAFASGPAIAKAYGSGVSTKEVFAKANAGEERAITVLKERADALARGLYALVCVLDPSQIVLGGSVAYHNPRFVEEIVAALSKLVTKEQAHILKNIQRTVLGGDNGVVGAGLLAFNL